MFDKTGTLTLGEVRVREIATFGDDGEAEALALACTLEQRSEHPIAAALRAAAMEDRVAATSITPVAGQGIEGIVDGERMRIGRPDFVAALCGTLPQRAAAFVAGAQASSTVVLLGGEGRAIAGFALGDTPRPDAAAAIAALRAIGVEPILMSGDRNETAVATAQLLGIRDARGDLSPEGKREAIRALQARGAVVAMIGDGVNDAPGLAQAQVSISLGSATPLAQWTADVVILSDAVGRVSDAIAHARRTLGVVRQNLGWASVYNAIAIPAAALGYVTPLVAAIGMSLSSLVVVANALRVAHIPGGTPRSRAAPAAPLHDPQRI